MDRQQGRRHKAIGTERRRGILTDFVERRGIETADPPQLANQFAICDLACRGGGVKRSLAVVHCGPPWHC